MRAKKSERVWPGIAIPPGEHLAEELEARGMSQSELARKMGRPVQAVNEIVQGKKAITGATALQLEKTLGISAELWMSLEANYQLAKARLAQKKSGKKKARAAVSI
jgi:HTH-type transcriptional regulator/antitoxin HigA